MNTEQSPSYEELAARLAAADQTLSAIQHGTVDALIFLTPDGPQVRDLPGAEDYYRTLITQMSQGAAVVDRTGSIIFANAPLAEMLAQTPEKLVGGNLAEFVDLDDHKSFGALLSADSESFDLETRIGADGAWVDVSLSARGVNSFGTPALCIMATDRRPQRLAEAARRRADLADERERVARDLHDVVIQSLYAIGLRLNGVAQGLDPMHSDRIVDICQDLDKTITEIRRTIFGLRGDIADLRGTIIRLVEEASLSLGFPVELKLNGAINLLVPKDDYLDITAVLRELLSNAARHAEATAVTVEISVDQGDAGGLFRITVVDNGVGIPAGRVESGLDNLQARAEGRSGVFEIAPAVPRGTLASWQIPLFP